MHRLADLEAFELRMVEIERLVLASVPVGKTECFRPGPGLERCLTLPYRVGGIERVVLVLRPFEQMELDETGDLGQLRVAAQPDLLEGLFGAFLHTESVHGNEHHPSPDLDQKRYCHPVAFPQRKVIASRWATGTTCSRGSITVTLLERSTRRVFHGNARDPWLAPSHEWQCFSWTSNVTVCPPPLKGKPNRVSQDRNPAALAQRGPCCPRGAMLGERRSISPNAAAGWAAAGSCCRANFHKRRLGRWSCKWRSSTDSQRGGRLRRQQDHLCRATF